MPAFIGYAGDAQNLSYLDDLLGVTFDGVHIYCDASPTWSDFTGGELNFWLAPTVEWIDAVPNRTILISPGMIPANESEGVNDWRTQGASGDYNRYWAQWGTLLVENGLGHAHLRIGHECNGTWFNHFVGTTPQEQALWAEYFRQIVNTLRQVPGANFTYEFNVNAGVESLDPNGYYPGDEWVDVVGVDQYDGTVEPYTGPSGEQWDTLLNGQGVTGLGAMVVFAAAHGKPIAFSEYGLAAAGGTSNGFGDDPSFINGLGALIEGLAPLDWPGAPLPVCAYHALFNPIAVDTSTTPPTITSSAPYPLENAPNSLAAYQSLFGGKPTIAFDTASEATPATGTSLSWSHTCSGSDRILFVGVVGNLGSNGDISGVTYGGVALAQVGAPVQVVNDRWLYLFMLVAPPTGTNEIVVSAVASTFIDAMAVSYTGAKQSAQPDSSSTAVPVHDWPATSLTCTTMTVANNCWTVLFAKPAWGIGGVESPAALRSGGGVDGGCLFADSGGPKSPAGTVSLVATSTENAQGWPPGMAGIIASFAPVA